MKKRYDIFSRMQNKTGDDRAERDHAPDAQIGTGYEDEACDAERIEHANRSLFEYRKDIRQRQKLSVSRNGCDYNAHDKEHEDRQVQTVIQKEFRRLKPVHVILPAERQVFRKARRAVSETAIFLHTVDIRLIFCRFRAVDVGYVFAVRVEESRLMLVAVYRKRFFFCRSVRKRGFSAVRFDDRFAPSGKIRIDRSDIVFIFFRKRSDLFILRIVHASYMDSGNFICIRNRFLLQNRNFVFIFRGELRRSAAGLRRSAHCELPNR